MLFFSLIFLLCTGIFTCGESMNTYLHTYHLTADVSLALIWQVTDDLQNCASWCILGFQWITLSFDNSVIFLGSLHHRWWYFWVTSKIIWYFWGFFHFLGWRSPYIILVSAPPGDHTIPYNTIQYNIIQHNTIQYCIISRFQNRVNLSEFSTPEQGGKFKRPVAHTRLIKVEFPLPLGENSETGYIVGTKFLKRSKIKGFCAHPPIRLRSSAHPPPPDHLVIVL